MDASRKASIKAIMDRLIVLAEQEWAKVLGSSPYESPYHEAHAKALDFTRRATALADAISDSNHILEMDVVVDHKKQIRCLVPIRTIFDKAAWKLEAVDIDDGDLVTISMVDIRGVRRWWYGVGAGA